MIDPSYFADFVSRIRAGDEEAAAELVRRYEPFIRRAVRFHLRDPRLVRMFDSLDICQSVLASFFVRAAAGQYDLERPEQLLHLLVRMARSKLVSQARQQQRLRRDCRRLDAAGAEQLEQAVAPDPTPSELVAGRDLLEQVRRRLTTEEWRVAELRSQGSPWDQIAAELGGTAQSRRMQLARALTRVSRQLGLEGDSDA
jgi:RNA polymerase sigma-70 factor (ECF subfamily)